MDSENSIGYVQHKNDNEDGGDTNGGKEDDGSDHDNNDNDKVMMMTTIASTAKLAMKIASPKTKQTNK